MKPPRGWGTALSAILAFSVFVVVVAVLFETKLIYFPSSDFDVTPETLGLPHEELTLVTSDDERLHAWFLPLPAAGGGEERYTVLMCHGNAGNISHRLERALLMQSQLGTDVLLFDYRGFGRSSGRPNEAGTYEDARTAYRYLIEARELDERRVVLLGESLGAAVALHLAIESKAAGLVLEAPFTSIPDMARVVYPFVPTGWVRTRYDNSSKIAELRMPVLVVHGTRDPTVPFEHGERIFEAAPEPKRFLAIEDGGHADSYVAGGEEYWRVWREFLTDLGGS